MAHNGAADVPQGLCDRCFKAEKAAAKVVAEVRVREVGIDVE